MKALEILKWLAASGVFQKEANEAIAELEELLKTKSCDGCKDKDNKITSPCMMCSRSYTDYYEPKEPK